MTDFSKTLSQKAKEIETFLKKQIPLIKNAPQIIKDSMAYSLNAGGKRIRPVLTTATAEAFGLNPRDVAPAACALEMMHTYSLIHDDLPSMDNDDLRRGKPTNHKIFGEDLALLAGDGLLTVDFETFVKNADVKSVGPQRTVKALKVFAQAAGVSGMIGGQTADIFAEGIMECKSSRAAKLGATKYFKGKKPGYYLMPGENKEVSAAQILSYIHKNKTGALIVAAVETGAILAGAKGNDLKNIKKYAAAIGFAFQVVDDILDVTATQKQIGKSNSDSANNKLTHVTLYGLEESKKAAAKALRDANKALDGLKKADRQKLKFLYDTAGFIVNRSY